MGKYAEDARQLLRLVGGKENIAAVSHCMTRMRFALADPEKADVKAIEALKSVKGSFTQSGQFQVIIGNTVADFYNEFVKRLGLRGIQRRGQERGKEEPESPAEIHCSDGGDFRAAAPGYHYRRPDSGLPQLYRQSVSL